MFTEKNSLANENFIFSIIWLCVQAKTSCKAAVNGKTNIYFEHRKFSISNSVKKIIVEHLISEAKKYLVRTPWGDHHVRFNIYCQSFRNVPRMQPFMVATYMKC